MITFNAKKYCRTLWEFDDRIVQETSKESYKKILSDGSITIQSHQLYVVLKAHPEGLSNQDLEQYTKLRISSITARINELRKQGLVECAGTKKNKITGKNNLLWKATEG